MQTRELQVCNLKSHAIQLACKKYRSKHKAIRSNPSRLRYLSFTMSAVGSKAPRKASPLRLVRRPSDVKRLCYHGCIWLYRLEEIEKWFKEYDKDASGDIDRDELGKLMTAVKRDATQDAETAPVEDNILDLIMKKYADASGRIKQDRILNAIKAFKSYLAQELTYKDLFAKCTWSTP